MIILIVVYDIIFFIIMISKHILLQKSYMIFPVLQSMCPKFSWDLITS